MDTTFTPTDALTDPKLNALIEQLVEQRVEAQTATDWTEGLTSGYGGKPERTGANFRRALRTCPALAGAFAMDAFTGVIRLTRALPWRADGASKPLRDADMADLDVYLTDQARLTLGKETRWDQLLAEATANEFDSLQDWFNALPDWDGEERMAGLWSRYMGAQGPATYLGATARAFLISAVARAFLPEAKVDTLPILEGAQGSGKSTALSILSGDDWFSDNIGDIRHKDAMINLMGVWFVELAELDALNKADAMAIKRFLTTRFDRFRMPYGRISERQPRRCVFAGTTNETAYLKDPSGGRRFWPIACGTIDLAALRADREQLWAEALDAYRQGEPWHLSDEAADEARTEQAARYDQDPWAPIIEKHLHGKEQVSATDLLTQIKETPGNWDKLSQRRITNTLRSLGWEPGQRWNGKTSIKIWVPREQPRLNI